MAKTLLTFTGKCASANKNANGCSIMFARNIETTDKGPAAREVVAVNLKDQNAANSFTVMDAKGNGPDYTITISQ